MSPERAGEYALGGPAAPHDEGKHTPPPTAAGAPVMRVFALGQARVERAGRPIDSPDWIQKPRELLYYLLLHPEGRTKEQIGLALWPEASTSQLRSSFHDTLYRLRQALRGKEWISFEKGRYAFGRSLSYSYDVEVFERKLLEARSVRSEEPKRAISPGRSIRPTCRIPSRSMTARARVVDLGKGDLAVVLVVAGLKLIFN
jgi:hypothetical protein